MTDQDQLVAAAIDDLYGIDPAGFTAARNARAATARKAGAPDAAKAIAALRRPTRAAWILNQLARSQPDLAAEFAGLGEQLRQAHLDLDGDQIRELSKQRRLLIDQTSARAFAQAQVDGPTAALRDDVAATLGAVLGDAAVAQRFAAGALVTAEDQSSFGPAGAHLTGLPTLRPVAKPAAPAPVRSNARAAREQNRREAALAKAETELAQAAQAQIDADDAAAEATQAVRRLTEQLADAKRREDDALLDARRAELRIQQAQKTLESLN